MRVTVLVLAALTAGCGSLFCTDEYNLYGYKVTDGAGKAVIGATVTATNGTKVESGLTDSTGTAQIGEAIGEGKVTFVATLDARRSDAVVVEWECDRCKHCHPIDSGETVLTLP